MIIEDFILDQERNQKDQKGFKSTPKERKQKRNSRFRLACFHSESIDIDQPANVNQKQNHF